MYVTKPTDVVKVIDIIESVTGDLFIKSRSHNQEFGDQSMLFFKPVSQTDKHLRIFLHFNLTVFKT